MPIKLIKPQIPFDGVTPKSMIQKMVQSYKNDLKAMGDSKLRTLNTSTLGQSSCIWISVNEIQELITDNKANGIRVYFGQHTKETVPPGNETYEGQLSIVFVATIDTINPTAPTYEFSEDQLTEDEDSDKANSVSVAGPFKDQGADKVPICNPTCPRKQFMKLDI